jgi:arylsulfatase A-like enzyme/Flp pilus assembly protein TadD
MKIREFIVSRDRKIPGKRPFVSIHLLLCIAIAGAFPAYGTADNARAEGMNLLVITLDTMRADRIGAYGYEKADTPHLDDLAKNGVIFTDCYSPVPLTLPAHCSLFTGRYPLGHRVRDNGTFLLSGTEITLAEMMKNEGYDTYAVIASFVLMAKFGLKQGFSVYDDSLQASELVHNFHSEIAADVVYTKFKNWFDKRREEKFFAWVHFYDPHLPYSPPEEFIRNRNDPSDLYDGEVAYTDVFVGKIIQDLKNREVLDSTLVIIVGDHGEAFGEHQEYGHSVFCYEENLRVPLVFYCPPLFQGGSVVKNRVSLVDIMPTLLEIYRMDKPPALHGKSFSKMLTGGNERGERSVYIESMYGRESLGWAPLTGIIDGPYKYISLPEPELYDLSKDSQEKNNLYVKNRDVVTDLDKKLKTIMLEYSTSRGNARRRLSAEDRERLQSLGYISSSSPGANRLLDPKKGIILQNRFSAANDLIEDKRLDLAEAELKKIAAQNPDIKMLQYYELLAKIHEFKNDHQRMVNTWKEAVEVFPENSQFKITLGFKLFQMNRLGEAEEIGREIVRIDKNSSRGFILLGSIAEKRYDFAKAMEYFTKALDLEPNNVTLKISLARSLVKKNLQEKAWIICREILDDDTIMGNPDYADVLSKVGILLTEMNRIEQAFNVLSQASSMDESNPETWNYLGVVYYRQNDFNQALGAYQRAVKLDPGFASAFNNLGTLYLRRYLEKKNPSLMTQAMDAFNRAIAKDPGLASAYNGRASAFKFSNHPHEAIRDWKRALELQPDFVDVYFNLGITYLQAGDKSEALKTLMQCKEKFYGQLPPSEKSRLDRLLAEANR